MMLRSHFDLGPWHPSLHAMEPQDTVGDALAVLQKQAGEERQDKVDTDTKARQKHHIVTSLQKPSRLL